MKINIFTIIFSLIYLSTQSQATGDSLKVLFIGNSITYFNNMPYIFRDIANQKQKNVSVTMYAPGGTGIVNHYIDPNVYSLFKNNVWDILILQPGSSESAGASYPVDTTSKRAKMLLDSLYKYSACAQVYLYEIPYGVPSSTAYSTYFSVQSMIRDSVSKMADSLKVQFIPAGECTRAYYNVHQNMLLHNSYNDIHPGPFGSYLVACAFYTSIFQDSVSPCTYYNNLPPDTCQKFFRIADSIVLSNLPAWNINTYNLNTAFNSAANNNQISFTNTSSNYANCLWHFGDNATSTAIHPSHSYTASGLYIVKLLVSKNTCKDSIEKKVNIQFTDVDDADNVYHLRLFPNPANDLINLGFIAANPGSGNIQICNSLGTLVKTIALSIVSGPNYFSFSTADLNNGIYFLYLKKPESSHTTKIIINHF